jgi:HKD family nuclease
MTWYLQTPNGHGETLLANILAACGPAKKGGAAFAFATAQGVRLLAAEEKFKSFLNAAKFTIVIGLDAITDSKTIDELRKLRKSHPNLTIKFFLHKKAGSLFHPKTMWLLTPKGGVIITGSGNLTSGGLRSNWEATAVEMLTIDEMAAAEKKWQAWLKAHSKELLDLDDPKVQAKAKSNRRLRLKIKKAMGASADEATEGDAQIESAEESVEEIDQELKLNPVLIAEIPKASTRWEQANFNKKSFIEFFGVTIGVPKAVHFFYVNEDGTLTSEKERPQVTVKSRNYRFELSAAKGRDYPEKGVPIGVFKRVSDSDFHYILLMPGDKSHQLIAKFLDTHHPKKSHGLRRVQMVLGDLQKIWADAPFL